MILKIHYISHNIIHFFISNTLIFSPKYNRAYSKNGKSLCWDKSGKWGSAENYQNENLENINLQKFISGNLTN